VVEVRVEVRVRCNSPYVRGEWLGLGPGRVVEVQVEVRCKLPYVRGEWLGSGLRSVSGVTHLMLEGSGWG